MISNTTILLRNQSLFTDLHQELYVANSQLAQRLQQKIAAYPQFLR